MTINVMDLWTRTRRLLTHYRRYKRATGKARDHNWPKFGRRIEYFDVGSAGYLKLPFRFLQRDGIVQAHGFDPGDPKWVNVQIYGQEVVNRIFRLPRIEHLQFALGDRNGEATLFVTRHPGCSSLRRPDPDAVKHLDQAAMFDIVQAEQVQVHRLDTLIGAGSAPQPDVVKIDVQGSEFEVLVGLGPHLDLVTAIEFEVRMRPIYEHEKVFHDFYSYLTEKGFVLRDLHREQALGGEALEFFSYWAREPQSEWQRFVLQVWAEAHGLDLTSHFDSLMGVEGHLMSGRSSAPI